MITLALCLSLSLSLAHIKGFSVFSVKICVSLSSNGSWFESLPTFTVTSFLPKRTWKIPLCTSSFKILWGSHEEPGALQSRQGHTTQVSAYTGTVHTTPKKQTKTKQKQPTMHVWPTRMHNTCTRIHVSWKHVCWWIWLEAETLPATRSHCSTPAASKGHHVKPGAKNKWSYSLGDICVEVWVCAVFWGYRVCVCVCVRNLVVIVLW